MPPRPKFADLPPTQQAGILCNDAKFQFFVGARMGLNNIQVAPLAAAEFLRRQCNIKSRCELDTSETARRKLAALRTDFDAWRGKIPSPR